MQVRLNPELERQLTLSASRQGRLPEEIVSDILAGYLADEARLLDELDTWSAAERYAITAHIHEGYLQAIQGRTTLGVEARQRIQAMKEDWLRRDAHKGSRPTN